MDSNNNNKKYTDDQIQFLQKLVKEQRDLEQQIKVLKKASKERECRKKQVDTTIIKYFKTNDISHINLQSSNCRIECVTVKTRSGLSQRYVTDMLDELLKDEELAKDVLDYILSERQVTHKQKLKTIENYQQKRKRKQPIKQDDKQDVKYTEEEKSKLVLKLKDRINGKNIPKKEKEKEINLVFEENKVNTEHLASNILKEKLSQIKENAKQLSDESNIDMEIELNKPIEHIINVNKEPNKSTYKTNKVVPKKNNIILKKEVKKDTNNSFKLNKNIQNILDTSNTNEIIKEQTNDIISFDKPQKIAKNGTLETQINDFIKNQMADLAPNSVTNLTTLYQDLMKRANTGIDIANIIKAN
jgi:hypothetical protein